MKFMKLGTSVDTFYTEDNNIRTLDCAVPSDLIVHINNTSYHLHQYALLPKCGVLQEIFVDGGDSSSLSIELHDVPGGEEAFELCAKFCYGIQIRLSAENFVLAYCAAKFLRMTEVQEKGNLILKLESFFESCVLEGWKDSIVALKSTLKVPDSSEQLGLTGRFIDSIVDKILVPPPKVMWSFTYSRSGYERRQQAVPMDWWTEDLSCLDAELFRSVIVSVRSTSILLPQLIGEALHVYASCNLLPKTASTKSPQSSTSGANLSFEAKKQMLESIASLIPLDRGSVSVRFLLRLLSLAHQLEMSSSTKTELTRRCSAQLGDATVDDLLLVSSSSTDQDFYDIEPVKAVLGNYLTLYRRLLASHPEDKTKVSGSFQKVGKLIDSLLQIVASDVSLPVSDFISLAKLLPKIARPDHDELYKAINIYLKEHPNLPKPDKKSLCSILDCERLSHEVAAQAVKNDLLPLRTVVQVLFFEQERASRAKPPKSKTTSGSSDRRQNSSQGKSSNSPAADHRQDLTIAVADIRPRKDEGSASRRNRTTQQKTHLKNAIKKILDC
uniref:Phototropic-responsive NPH3 family protein n=1 Tax=Kalanchoe fedtschenkoi TaxID=63787 RepID=A0A7N0UXD7_KALFE